jgi:hypothetical protein
MSDNPVGRIRSQAIQRWDLDGRPGDVANYAIALALEEAAKVADRYEIPMCETSASHIAAAIRGMVKD